MTRTRRLNAQLTPRATISIGFAVLASFSVLLSPLAAVAGRRQESKPTEHCEQHKPGDIGLGAEKAALPFKKMPIPDVAVTDQDGRRLNFYSDLVKGKVVAINFIFTTCTTICPPLAATFAKVGNLGGERFGKEFNLISISVDPVTDTPQRLKAWAAKFNAKPGWSLVTGKKDDIDTLLKSLGAFSARVQDHTPMALVINEDKGVWTRTYGLASAAKLLSVIDAAIGGSVIESARTEDEK
jgi:protein SCO1/2